MATRMKRTTVFFSAQQERAINKEARKLGVSAAEVLRRLVDEGLLDRDYFIKQNKALIYGPSRK
jgi:hypothetical protein